MELLIKIKEFLLKIWTWIINFFTKKNKLKDNNKIVKKQNNIKKNSEFKPSINRDETISNNIIAMYPGVFPKEIEGLNKKINQIKRKILGYSDENIEEELENLAMINKAINNNQVLVNQISELNELIDITLFDEELNLNTNEKINLLKDNITNLFDENLKDYEKHIIEKAYYEYEKVNYVIVTSMLIDELYDELEKVNINFHKNRYSKKEFIDKVREIERKIERLEKINNREEVQKEIESLKSDLYTKRKDKYDLLYNNEIFINFEKQCDEIIKQVEFNEKRVKEVKVQQEKVQEARTKQEELEKKTKKKELEKNKEELQEEKLREDNILKRFMDLELARQILAIHEVEKLKKLKKENIVEDTINSYYEFLMGDTHEFNFHRNKLKLEVTKLYNDTIRNICVLEEAPYIPVEHINIKLSNMVEETLSNQQRLNNLLIEKKKVNIEENDISNKVTEKLTGILQKEKEQEMVKGKPKALVRTYQPITNNKEDKNK